MISLAKTSGFGENWWLRSQMVRF